MKWISRTFLYCVLFLLFFGCEKPMKEEPIPSSFGSLAVTLLEDEFAGQSIVVVGSGQRQLVSAFNRNFAGGLRSFTPIKNRLPVVMEDDLGNRINIFGDIVFGPNEGERLDYINSGIGYWFAFSAAYPGVEINGEGALEVALSPDTAINWSVATDFVAQGAGFDAIRSIDQPEFEEFSIINTDPDVPHYLENNDLVVGVMINGEAKAYPHAILDWHEIVNDELGGVPISVTYCPLTGTAKVWERTSSGTYGVSGYVYNSNILAFDRETESFWMQLEATSVFGNRIGEKRTLIPFVETTWSTWQRMAPNPTVMTNNTGFERDYGEYPYGDYKTNDVVTYPLLYEDNRLPLKERVFCIIIDGKAKVYRLSDF